MERQIGGVGIYFRFSVEQGMQNHHGTQASSMSWIATQAAVYVSELGTSKNIDALLHNFDAATRHITLDQLGMCSSLLSSYASLIRNRIRRWCERDCSVKCDVGYDLGCHRYAPFCQRLWR
jgi:hypothetical protein